MRQHGTILLITNNFPPVRGGSASVYASLARCAGGQVIVLAPRINYTDGLPIIGWREHDRQAGYPIFRIPLLRTLIDRNRTGLDRVVFVAQDLVIRARVVAILLNLVMTWKVSAICIGELLASAWIVKMLRWIPKLRTTVYVHGEEITMRNASDPDNRVGWQALYNSDAIIVVSRFTESEVKRLLRDQSSDKIHLIENGVDADRFCCRPKSDCMLKRYGLDGRFVFVSVCRLVEKKGIDHTIRAFAKVLTTHPDSRYLIVGTGPFRPALEEICAAEGVSDRVIFAGEVPDEELVDHYRLGDVFVMPNRRMPDGDTEGFGLVFLEANGCGLPVISGRDGGSIDAVTHGDNGLVVDGQSVDEIANAMRRLRDEPGLYDAIRRGALAKAQQAGWQEKTRAFVARCMGE